MTTIRWPLALAEEEARIVGEDWFDTCPNCGGEGGFEYYVGRFGDGSDDIRWQDCPTCHASGWVPVDVPPQIDLDDVSSPERADDETKEESLNG